VARTAHDALEGCRSNEFSNLDLAKVLRDARLATEVGFSLELVHGIGTF
jgi:hypothetical protein